MRATVAADDPMESFRRELLFVCATVGIATQWLVDADDELLSWLMMVLSR